MLKAKVIKGLRDMITFTKQFWLHILLLTCLTTTYITHSASIIFDMGGVLMDTNRSAAFWHIGPINMLRYASTLKNPFKVHTSLFDFLDKIAASKDYTTSAKDAH